MNNIINNTKLSNYPACIAGVFFNTLVCMVDGIKDFEIEAGDDGASIDLYSGNDADPDFDGGNVYFDKIGVVLGCIGVDVIKVPWEDVRKEGAFKLPADSGFLDESGDIEECAGNCRIDDLIDRDFLAALEEEMQVAGDEKYTEVTGLDRNHLPGSNDEDLDDDFFVESLDDLIGEEEHAKLLAPFLAKLAAERKRVRRGLIRLTEVFTEVMAAVNANNPGLFPTTSRK